MVLLGMVDIAGQMESYKEGYESQGFKVFTMVRFRNQKYEMEYDFVYNSLYPKWLLKSRKAILLRKLYTLMVAQPIYWLVIFSLITRCDIFHFMWLTERENRIFLYILKQIKKKIIVTFVGSEVRWYPLWVKEHDERSLSHQDIKILMNHTKQSGVTLERQLKTVRVVEKYADIIMSVPEQSQLLLRPYFNFYIPLDLSKMTFQILNKSITSVAVGVTEPIFNNSDSVVHALEVFQKQSGRTFEIKVLKNMKHDRVLKELAESDIFIYTPYGCGTGRFGLEAVASGTLCMCGYDEAWYNIPPGLPIVPITESDFISKLEYYLDHREERERLIMSGKDWIAKYADPKWIVNDILKKIENPDENYDYIPAYFRDKAKFDSEGNAPDAVDICNKWTRYVKDCNWYKKYVPPGKRDGLIF